MDAKPKFNVIYSEEVIAFLNSLPAKTKAKIGFWGQQHKYVCDYHSRICEEDSKDSTERD